MKHSNKIERCKTFCTTPSSCIIKRRFFSEYAVLQRVSHHQCLVSIKDFPYLKHCVYLVFFLFFLSSKNPGNVTQTRLLWLYIINSVTSALSTSIKSVLTTPLLRLFQPSF